MKLAVVIAALATACASAPPRAVQQPRRLGDAMDETGMRFNRVGRAVLAGRWELATYDLAEMKEIFEDDLANSSWHGKPELSQLAQRFRADQLKALDAALRAHDRDASARAVAGAARACNECHQKADMAYIEISEQLGDQVPVVR